MFFVRIQENKDKKKSIFGHFPRSAKFSKKEKSKGDAISRTSKITGGFLDTVRFLLSWESSSPKLQ